MITYTILDNKHMEIKTVETVETIETVNIKAVQDERLTIIAAHEKAVAVYDKRIAEIDKILSEFKI